MDGEVGGWRRLNPFEEAIDETEDLRRSNFRPVPVIPMTPEKRNSAATVCSKCLFQSPNSRKIRVLEKHSFATNLKTAATVCRNRFFLVSEIRKSDFDRQLQRF
jgi:hypothetical protein